MFWFIAMDFTWAVWCVVGVVLSNVTLVQTNKTDINLDDSQQNNNNNNHLCTDSDVF